MSWRNGKNPCRCIHNGCPTCYDFFDDEDDEEQEESEEIPYETHIRMVEARKHGWQYFETSLGHRYTKDGKMTERRSTIEEALDDVEKLFGSSISTPTH
jgi:hypothetical protein